MKILKFLFGLEVKIQDPIIGELTAIIRGDNPSINYTWTGEHKLEGQIKPTVFILEGNKDGPYREQLKSIHRIVDTLDNVIDQLDSNLKQQQKIKIQYKEEWMSDFYLAAIVPYNPDIKGVGQRFEINFEPVEEDRTDYISLIWDNDRLTEIEAK